MEAILEEHKLILEKESEVKIENIMPRKDISDFKTRGAFTPAKKIDCGNYYTIYVSGIEPLKEESSNLVIKKDIESQTHEVFEQIGEILEQAGACFDNVVKAVIYVTNIKYFEIVSPIRAKYFENSMPASTMVEVSRLKRDGAKIEIEVTAMIEK